MKFKGNTGFNAAYYVLVKVIPDGFAFVCKNMLVSAENVGTQPFTDAQFVAGKRINSKIS